MDIVLERILSLIPKKPDGKFVHGAKKKFAESIGFSGGEIVTMWINGSSDSYKNYLYQIAAQYDVSVAWLRGESEQKKDPAVPGEVDATTRQLFDFVNGASDSELLKVLEYIEFIKSQRNTKN